LALAAGVCTLNLPASAAEPGGANGPNSAATAITNAAVLSPQVDPEVLRRAIEDLREQVNASSKELLVQTARDAEALSQRVDAAVAQRLAAMERSLAATQQRELESLRDSHRTFLLFAGVLAGLGFLGIIATAVVLARAVNRFSEVALSLPGPGHALPAPPERAALGPGDTAAISPTQVEEAAARFRRRSNAWKTASANSRTLGR
jgi:hypothetical protein